LTNTKNELTQALEKVRGQEAESLNSENEIKRLNIRINDLEEKKQKEADR